MTGETFAAAVLLANQRDDWRAVSAGRGGVAFFLTSDASRRARLLLQKDAPDGAQLVLGSTEIALCDLPSDELHSWVNHLNARRDAHPADVALLRRLWTVLQL